MSDPQPTKPIELFYSYSHKDEKLREKLETHLSLLKRQGVIAGWHDRKIGAGQEWANQIDEHLYSAQIILLLISASFLASDYCYDIELKRAMERHEAGEARVIPVILREVDWLGAPFGKLKALPTDAKAVTSRSWHNLDEAFANVARGIRNAVEDIVSHSYKPEPLASPQPGYWPLSASSLLPAGSPYNLEWYIPRSRLETTALNYLSGPGRPAVLWGPRRFGKSWLLRHLTELLRQQYRDRCKVINLDFGSVSLQARQSLDLFAQEIASELVESLDSSRANEWIAEEWRRPGNAMGKLGRLMERHILPEAPGLLILAVDRADALLGSSISNDVFSKLRSWVENISGTWQQLRLLLAVSTTPAQLTAGASISPFNVVPPIELEDFTAEQVGKLAGLQRLEWDETQLELLRSWVGGHPYLVHLVLYECALHGRSLHDVLSFTDFMESVFADHLRAIRKYLQENPEQAKAVCHVLANPGSRIDAEADYRLREAGILVRQETTQFKVRYRLYEEFLREYLCR